MYTLASIIEYNSQKSRIADISFFPDGSRFAVTCENANEVCIYNTHDQKLLRVYRNPDANFDQPHGIVVTDGYIITGQKHDLNKPGTFNIFRIDSDSNAPVCEFVTPFPHLREIHSIDWRNDILIASYCEQENKIGAIVSYKYDDNTGKINGIIDIHESGFMKLGDTKGIAFNTTGDRVYTTFSSARPTTWFQRICYRIYTHVTDSINLLLRTCSVNTRIKQLPKTFENGIAYLTIDKDGKFSEKIEKVICRNKFCRLENIKCIGDCYVITDAINKNVCIYNIKNDPVFSRPVQTIQLDKPMPHGVGFSPDGNNLVITTFGHEIKNNRILWNKWLMPLENKILIFMHVG